MTPTDDESDKDAIARRMNNGVRRALNTPPKPLKELVGKSERALSQRESRLRKAPRSLRNSANPSACSFYFGISIPPNEATDK